MKEHKSKKESDTALRDRPQAFVEAHALGRETGIASSTVPESALHRFSLSDAVTEDWEVLFNAVKTRLRQTVDDKFSAFPSPVREAAARVQASILECVIALDQVHAMLRHELAQHRPAQERDGPPSGD